MDNNTKNVQLHELIKNSLATYLSYKWSDNKLYLKKRRKKKNHSNKNNKENSKYTNDTSEQKKSSKIEKNRSIINLENDIFIYDDKTKTFTQLDLTECFKNGLKYRKDNPFENAKPKEDIKYELCKFDDNFNTKNEQIYQLINLKDTDESIQNIFEKNQEKQQTINDKNFNLFIKKELNKCTTKNFNKTFKFNQSKINSSIGCYTVARYQNISNKKDYQDYLIQQKMYHKGLQCKRSNQITYKNAKFSSTNDEIDYEYENLYEIIKKKKRLNKKHNSLNDLFSSININDDECNSSDELRKLLDENQSTNSSFSLSTNGDYTFISPQPLITYYRASSMDSFDNTNTRNHPIIVVATSTPISPICSGICAKKRHKQQDACCNCNKNLMELPQRSMEVVKNKNSCPGKCVGPCCKTDSAIESSSDSNYCCTNRKKQQNTTKECACKPPPKSKKCCDCYESNSRYAECICKILYDLKERIKKQTEEQNRNLDQIIDELSKQDRELKDIRDAIEKSMKKKEKVKTVKENICSCYTATLEYKFTTDLIPLPDLTKRNELEYSKNSLKKKEPEIIELFGNSGRKNENYLRKGTLRENSWKALWVNTETKSSFMHNLFKNHKSYSSTSFKENRKIKKYSKQWFSKLFNLKKKERQDSSKILMY